MGASPLGVARTERNGIRGGRVPIVLLGALLVCASAGPMSLRAQARVVPGGEWSLATPDLAPDHWAMQAARRAEALGLLSRPLPFRRAISLEVAAEVLDEAAERAAVRGPELEALVAGWRARFLEEFGGIAPREGGIDGLHLLGVRGRGEVVSGAGRVAPGYGELPPTRTGAIPVQDAGALSLEMEVVAAIGSRVGILLQPGVVGTVAELRRADLVVGLGGWSLAAGRQPIGFGKTRPGGVVLAGAVPLDRVELRTERPGPLPGALRRLGPTGLQLFVSRITDDRHAREPYFWGGSVSIQPFPRFGVAVHRAAMFGGKGQDVPMTLKTIVDMLIGRVRGLGFENQIVSVEGRYHLPTEEVVPLTAYLEWGAEDAAGGWWDVPGRVIGLETPALPADPRLSLGVAYTAFEAHCCGNPPWYRHGAFRGNWAAGDRPLGHPLGGEGSEWLAYGSFDQARSGVRIDARLFRRDRAGRNLYVPGRQESVGGAIHAVWRPRPRLDVDIGLRRESGSGWSEHELRAGANLFF